MKNSAPSLFVILLVTVLQSCELPQTPLSDSSEGKQKTKKKSKKKKKKSTRSSTAKLEDAGISSFDTRRINETPSRSGETTRSEVEVDTDRSEYSNSVSYRELSYSQRSMIDQINHLRRKGCECGGKYFTSVPPLKVNNKLIRTANQHASDMHRKRRLSHSGKNGQGMGFRLKDEGYNYHEASQNITNNSSSASEALSYLMKNPKNCANIMRADFTDVGVGQSGNFWTQLFAKPILKSISNEPFYKPQTVSYTTNSSFKDQMLKEVNTIRTKGCYCGNKYLGPVHPLKWNNKLERSSYLHARDMAKQEKLSHYGSDGSDIAKRVERVGYNYKTAGENVSYRKFSLQSAVQSWKRSPKHCENLMRKEFTEMGAAEYQNFWAQNFGSPYRH